MPAEKTIILKHSKIIGKKPTLADLVDGEPAINIADGKMYIKQDDGAHPAKIIEITGQGEGGDGGDDGFSPYISDGSDGHVAGNWIDKFGDTGVPSSGTPGPPGEDGEDADFPAGGSEFDVLTKGTGETVNWVAQNNVGKDTTDTPDVVDNVWVGTKTQYDVLPLYKDTVIYFIKEV